MNKNLKVSIIIPTYNRKNLFELALKSALAQDYENKEIVITDDNSNDGTSELAKEYEAKFECVKYFTNQTYERGPNGNKNNGFDKSSGDAFVILDDDDLLLEGAISKMVNVLNLGYHSVWANCYYEINGEKTEKFSGFGLEKSQEINKQDYYDGKIRGEFLVMFRREAIGDRRFEKGLYGSENTLWIYLFDFPAYYLHEAVRIYRFQRDDSVTTNALKRPLSIMKGYALMADLLIKKAPQTDPNRIAILYKTAAYYAKMGGEYKKMYQFIFKSLRAKPTKEALAMLALSLFPRSLIISLSKFRLWLKGSA